MRKKIIFLIGVIATLFSCQNQVEDMSEYSNSDKTIFCKIPVYMKLTKETTKSLLFEGNRKLVNIMWMESANGDKWDIEKFTQQMIGGNSSNLTLVEHNDTLIAYEIQKGMTTIPAHIISLHEKDGYSIMVCTMGMSMETHQSISNAIRCKSTNHITSQEKIAINKNITYDGEYIKLLYPEHWDIDEHPNTLTADVYIGQKNHAFGVWLFRFEIEDGITFKEGMIDVANNWREIAEVDVSYKRINGKEWCRQDIRMNMQGQENRQVSYYCQKDNYVYNVKFGNARKEVDENIATIDSIMSSIILK